jgi:alpha-galactosidase
MKTIVLLGVGSTYFTKGIVESLIRNGGEFDLRLVDIDQNCLDIAVKLAGRLVTESNAPIKIIGSKNREEILPGAEIVTSTIGVGGRRAWEKDVAIFRQFNINQTTGDTYGAGGVSRALRQVPVMVSVAKDMEKLCPDALLINFSNPLTVVCRAITKTTKIRTIGLCTGVKWWHHHLAQFIGIPPEEVWCEAIGVNHFTWITRFDHNGRDAFPLLRRKIKEDRKEMEHNPLTWDLFESFGYFPVVGDGHISEFIPGWQGKNAYYGHTLGVDAHHNFEEYASQFDVVFKEMEDEAYGRKPLTRGGYSYDGQFKEEVMFEKILAALSGETEFYNSVNLPNTGQATNLPPGAVLESTAQFNGSGIHPFCFGELAPGITAILQRIISVQELTVDAAISGDRHLILQALIAGMTVKTKPEAEKMLQVIIDTHRDFLPAIYQ